MHRPTLLSLSLSLLLLGTAATQAADVSVQINIGVPTVTISEPPPMVWSPTARVYLALNAPRPMFYIEGQYFLFHNNSWFISAGYGGPWAAAPSHRVPAGLRTFRPDYWQTWHRDAEERHRHNDDREHPSFYGRRTAAEAHRRIEARQDRREDRREERRDNRRDRHEDAHEHREDRRDHREERRDDRRDDRHDRREERRDRD